MQRTSPNNKEWRRYKEVSIPWAQYDRYRLNESKCVLDLRYLFIELDKPIQRKIQINRDMAEDYSMEYVNLSEAKKIITQSRNLSLAY